MHRQIVQLPVVDETGVMPHTGQSAGVFTAEHAGAWLPEDAAPLPRPPDAGPRMTLDDYYHASHARTPFTAAFLGAANVRALGAAFKADVDARVGRATPPFPRVLLSAMQRLASRYAGEPAARVPDANADILTEVAPVAAGDAMADTIYRHYLDHGAPHAAELPFITRSHESEEVRARKGAHDDMHDGYVVTGSDSVAYADWWAGRAQPLQLDPPTGEDAEFGFY